MHKKKLCLGVTTALALVAAATPLHAQDQDQEAETTSLEEVVVTGSRIRQNPLDNRTPIQTFTEEDIDLTSSLSAADYLQRLPGSFAGIEEPLAVGDQTCMASLFRETGIPVILDESLLRAGQVAGLAEGIGWRINLRVSKLGGLLRSLDVLEAARDRGIPVIVGAQVGETSLLTRAALTLATAAGDLLAGQEGAFGTHLLSRELCEPVLMFGAGGRLDADLIEALAGRPGFGLDRASGTDTLLSREV